MIRNLFLLIGVAVLFTGCAAHTKYNWGGYDDSLYSYYKSPENEAQLEAKLKAVIESTDSKRGAVPPGIYAEYGYLLLQKGNSDEAMRNFNLEKAHWPESSVFMDTMIASAARRPAAAAQKSGVSMTPSEVASPPDSSNAPSLGSTK